MKLSETQKRALLSSMGSKPFDGLVVFNGSGTGVGLARAAWTKMLEGLTKSGLVTPYVHGGYELTPEGFEVRDELDRERQAGKDL